MTTIHTYTDGGARGNPGPAAIGVVLKNQGGDILATHKEYLGEATNNQAEYRALIKALEMAKEAGADEVVCYLDSELVVKQLKREYKVKNENIAQLFVLAWNLSTGFRKVSFTHIRREYNKEADALVNESLDEVVGPRLHAHR